MGADRDPEEVEVRVSAQCVCRGYCETFGCLLTWLVSPHGRLEEIQLPLCVLHIDSMSYLWSFAFRSCH
jgi:hypothetical protein